MKSSLPIAVLLLAFALNAGAKGADLVRSDTVRGLLAREDHAELLAAQQKEAAVAAMAGTFADNYRTMTLLAGEYNNATSAARADTLLARYKTLEQANNTLADTTLGVWSTIFDNKSYCYNYILDKLGHRELLMRFERQARECQVETQTRHDETVSPAMIRYRSEKGLLLDYEMRIAATLGLGAAGDSLTRAEKQLTGADFDFRPIELRRMNFIDYSPVKLGATPVYGLKNPIPACTIYDKGIVYRILTGSYPTAQPTTIFKGLSPVAAVGQKGQYNYYAGGYATLREALAGLAIVRKAAIRGTKPEVVVWEEGRLRNISQESAAAEAAGTRFRVEVAVAENQTREALEAIRSQGDREVTRSKAGGTGGSTGSGASGAVGAAGAAGAAGNPGVKEVLFIVGSFDTLIDARIYTEELLSRMPLLRVEIK
ncbi:hypothetical protein FACS1894159_09960 [Bacteroidia bacterium]|nr:hypothetical protein FACS1894159_09960 [Bacteroidia bacterium]